jgi:TolA-binding protein
MGVCRFGVEDYDGAKTTFKKFIDEYAEDALFPEALSMYGDLLGGDGRLDEALACYRQAVSVVKKNYREEKIPAQKAQAVLPATYAVFQAARTLEADAESYEEAKEPQTARSKYQELIDLVEDYKSYFAENADWAQSVFWVGKAETALGEKGRAIQAYLDALIQYGSDPAQEGVSAILFDLAEMIRNAGDQVSAEDVTEKIQAARTNAKSRTLRIRLDVLLAELNGRAPDLGRRLLETEKDLTPVPPSGLALMCAALLEQKDYSRSTEFFDYFTAHYDASPFMKNAYRLRAEDLYLQKRYDDALPLALETLGLYGADADTGWAQLMKGNIELIRGDYTEAEKTFNAIFNVRAWRGSVSAEAMLRMAQSWYQQGNYEKAFAFFQRTYLLYKAYDGGRWAADAYLMSADCLRHLGRDSAARNTYRAMLLDEYVRDLPQAETAKTALGPQETAELLAGRTNTMETVEAEVKP